MGVFDSVVNSNILLAGSLKLLLLPIILYINWEIVASYGQVKTPNPFANLFLLSGYISESEPEDPRYRKTWWDLAFLAYYVVFYSFIRQTLLFYISRPAARYFGLKRQAKIDRFGEQVYALVYFSLTSVWGYVSLFLECLLLTF